MATLDEQAELLRALGFGNADTENTPEMVEAIRPQPPLSMRVDAERELRASRGLGERGEVLPPGPERDAAEARARARIETIEGMPAEPGGSRSDIGSLIGVGPVLPRPPQREFFEVVPASLREAEARIKAEAAALQSEGFADRILGIIAPQVLGAREDIDFEAARDRIRTSARRMASRALEASQATDDEGVKTLARLLRVAERADPEIRPLLVRAASVRTPEDLASVEDALENPEPGSPLAPGLTQQGAEWFASMLTEEGPDGTLVESDTATLLRGLGTGVSGIAGLAEGLVRVVAQVVDGRPVRVTDTLLDAMEEAVREGQGFVDVLGRIGNQTGEIVDGMITADPEGGGVGVKEVGQVLGGLGGLAVDFYIPADLFVGKLLGTVGKTVSKVRAPKVDDLVRRVDEAFDLPSEGAPIPDRGGSFDPTNPEDLSRLVVDRLTRAENEVAEAIRAAGKDPVETIMAIPETIRNPLLVDTAKALGITDPDEIAGLVADPRGADSLPVARTAYEVKLNEVARAVGLPPDEVLTKPEVLAKQIIGDQVNAKLVERSTIPLGGGINVPLTTGWVRVSDRMRVPRHAVEAHMASVDKALKDTGVREALEAANRNEAVPAKVFRNLPDQFKDRLGEGLSDLLSGIPASGVIPPGRLTKAIQREILDGFSTAEARNIPGAIPLPSGRQAGRLPRSRAEVVFEPGVFDRELRSSKIMDALTLLGTRGRAGRAVNQGLLGELTRDVRNQLGSSSEVFTARWREARAAGLGPEEAVEKAVLAEFPDGLGEFTRAYVAGVLGGLERGFEEVRAASGQAVRRAEGRSDEVGRINRAVRALDEAGLLDIPTARSRPPEGGTAVGVREAVESVHDRAEQSGLRGLIKPGSSMDDVFKALGPDGAGLNPVEIQQALASKPIYKPGPTTLAAVFNQARAARVIAEAGRRFRQAIPDQILGGRDLVGQVASDIHLSEAIKDSSGFATFTFPSPAQTLQLEKEARKVLETIPDWLSGSPAPVNDDVMALASRSLAKYVPDREVAAALVARANGVQDIPPPTKAAEDLARTLARLSSNDAPVSGGLEALLAQPAVGEGEAALDIIQQALRTASVTEDLGTALREVNPVRAYMDSLKPVKVLDTLDRVAKGGLLGGWVAPNLPYHVANFVSAPAIILQTLGTKEALAALGDLMKRPLTAGMDIIRPFRESGLDEVVVPKGGPTGKAYTRRDILRIMAENGVTRSQAAAESAAGLAATIQRLGRSGLFGPVTRNFDPTQLTLWNQLANDTDLFWRAGVLKRALAEGKSEADALTRARTGLLDYGDLSDFERRYINRLVWFWSFQSRMLSATAKNLVDPDGIVRLERASRLVNHDISGLLEAAGVEGAAWDNRVMPPEYGESRVLRALINDPVARQRWGLYGPAMPMPDALMMITDIGAGLVHFGKDLGGETGKTTLEMQREIQGDLATLASGRGSIASKGLGLLLGFEAPPFGLGPGGVQDAKPSSYVDPRYAAALKASGLWEAFTALVPVDLVNEPGRPQGYRVRKGGEQTWAWLRLASLATGIDRSARLYGPLLAEDTSTEDSGVGPVPRQLRDREALLYALGIATPARIVSEEAAESSRAWSNLYDIKDAAGR